MRALKLASRVLGGGVALYAAVAAATFLGELLRAVADEVEWNWEDEL